MKIREFLKYSVLAASLLVASALPVTAQPAPGGAGAGNRPGGFLTTEQQTKLREAIQGEIAPLNEKLLAAQKEAVKAGLDTTVSEADFKAKVEAVHKIQTDISVVRLKGVRAIASTLTEEQKTRLSSARDGGYTILFGGGFGGAMGGGRQGGNRAGGPNAGGNATK
jgi:Spy/CpxP family protein refolding chaperone